MYFIMNKSKSSVISNGESKVDEGMEEENINIYK